jgi:Na+-transporting NADH:ubiquinone oxidoreductase subunit C
VSQQRANSSNRYTIIFIVILSFFCAFVLAVLASALQEPREEAKEIDRSTQMLIAAQIYNPNGYFQVKIDGKYVPAKCLETGELVPEKTPESPTKKEILTVVRTRIKPFLVNDKGEITTFEQAKLNLDEYVAKNKKRGYANLPLKLIYEIVPNPQPHITQASEKPEGYIIPVSGFGLWDYIYGFIAIAPDGDTVIGISWYEQKETPGLGANIAEPSWQSQFPGKKIFQPDSTGKTDFQKSSLGIVVVRGKVKEVLDNTPKAENAVDGMAGATLTGNGVTKAYKDSLGPYRPFFIRIHEEEGKK